MKVLKSIIFTALFSIIFTVSVKAQTYQANQVENSFSYGDLINVGDVITFGSGHCGLGDYNEICVNDSGSWNYINVGEQYTITKKGYFSEVYMGEPRPNQLYLAFSPLVILDTQRTMTVNVGDTVTITPNYKGEKTNDWSFSWCDITDLSNILGLTQSPNGSLVIENIQKSMNGHKITYNINVTQGHSTTLYQWKDNDHGMNIWNGYIKLIVKDPNEKDDTNTNIKENDKIEETKNTEDPKTKDALPYGTVMCGNGGKGNGGKDAVGIKVLKPEQRDTTNQEIFAKAYFKNKDISKVFSYNVYPPYGVNASYKNAVKTLYWNNTGLKKGDEVYAIWYCQSSKKGVQVIKCDIDENGIVSIRLPQLGETSVITLIKVK